MGITKPKYIDDEIKVKQVKLSNADIEELEKLAAETNVDTRDGWEQPMDK